jgi:hypothetical protein
MFAELTKGMVVYFAGVQGCGRDVEVVSAARRKSLSMFVACSGSVLFLGARGDGQLPCACQISKKRLFHQSSPTVSFSPSALLLSLSRV